MSRSRRLSRRTWLAVVPATLLAAVLAAVSTAPRTVDYAALRGGFAASDALLLDRHGQPLHELRVDPRGRRLPWVDHEALSPALARAIVAAEDRRFADHRGVDWLAAAAALAARLRGGDRGGASTISMQLAALVDPRIAASGQRGLLAKVRQVRAAWRLEGAMDKPEILAAYLNRVTFRGELVGIAAASRGLFDKHPGGLTAEESAILAALVRGPNAAVAQVAARACTVARRLDAAADCAAVHERATRALADRPRLRQRHDHAPHVARRLLGDAARQVVSSLDGTAQRMAGEALRDTLRALRHRRVRDGAVLAVDNASGEVRIYLGNGGEDSSAWYVDGVQAPRQAGSTLKPFLYALAIGQRRLTAASLLADSPVDLQTPAGVYVPQNYDRGFRGHLSVRSALAGSVNVPAVRTLMLTGVDPFADWLRAAGFDHVVHDGDHYGYSLALGSAEVSLWQLVSAYRALATGGEQTPLTLRPGGPAAPPRRLLDPASAFIVADVLADRGARAGSFGLDNVLALPFAASVKTGTSKDMRDNWCVGFSSRYTVGVWVGNFDGSPMGDVSGVSGAAPLWARVMRILHAGQAPPPLAPPAGVERRPVTFGGHEPPRGEWFVAGTAMTRFAPRGQGRAARIHYPAEGMILALDNDIPASRQRVFFDASAPSPRWRLDGQGVAAGDGWTPRPGRHRLELVDAAGAVVDHVTFHVRGNSP